LGSLDPAVEVREGEKGKYGILGWGVQALLFSTLNTVSIYCGCGPKPVFRILVYAQQTLRPTVDDEPVRLPTALTLTK